MDKAEVGEAKRLWTSVFGDLNSPRNKAILDHLAARQAQRKRKRKAKT